MITLIETTNTSSSLSRTDLSSPQFPLSMDDGPFLNWSEDDKETYPEKAVVFQSLVATVKLRPVLDVSLEAKAVKFLDSVFPPNDEESADAFLRSLASNSDDSLTVFVQSIVVLISSTSRAITTVTMKILDRLMRNSYATHHRLALIKADLIPQLIMTLNPQSLSFAETDDIHTCLMEIITTSILFASGDALVFFGIEDHDEQQAAQETVLQQVVVPSEKYILHLCVNRYSIIDGDLSKHFLTLLTALLEISPYYRPTMEFLLHMPVILTIPSYLTFFEDDRSILIFLRDMVDAQRRWNEKGGEGREMWKKVHRLLITEGFEDVAEEKLQNDRKELAIIFLVGNSNQWNNLQGMNAPQRR
ncbi:hypothetical protein BLNAU_9946 [Blattamonas nauphoetae]|uniref:Uncharacterized protein n=1 Tax=Blattamonas nauphoetae TaxID=2049346 RepID=A0ABQ9XU53_9EUKA|nr:hypothetical protein BLNAU_9946 [Blattamonas nauphoetae]